jgi:hypothetical protein
MFAANMLKILVLDPEIGPGIMNVYIFLQPAINKGVFDCFCILSVLQNFLKA